MLLNNIMLLLARGACIETMVLGKDIKNGELLLARGACIETPSISKGFVSVLVAPRKRSMY